LDEDSDFDQKEHSYFRTHFLFSLLPRFLDLCGI
jgi:hypothetical protein